MSTSLAQQAQALHDIARRASALSEDKQQVFLGQLNERGIAIGKLPIVASPRTDDLPLSHAQQRLWFLWQLEPYSPAYNIASNLRLRGALDQARLQQAFDALVARHQALRTRFPANAGQARQHIDAPAPLTLCVEDLSHLPASERSGRAEALAREEAERPFDLAEGPLLRVGLLRLADDDHVLLLTLHHIIADGWSLNVLINEFAALYRGDADLPELSVQYKDYTLWQRSLLRAGEGERQLVYWRQQLAGHCGVLELPLDHPRRLQPSLAGGSLALPLSPSLTEALRAMARTEQISLFSVLLCAFNVLLWRYSGQRDLLVGVPIANRQRQETQGLIGLFVNTQVLRTQLDPRQPLRQLLAQVGEAARQGQSFQDLPFEQLVDALHGQRSLNRSPLFQVMFNHQQRQLAAFEQLPGLALEPFVQLQRSARFDLALDTEEDSQGHLSALFTYPVELFDAVTVQAMADDYLGILEQLVEQPQAVVGELGLARTPAWQEAFNATDRTFPDACLHSLFEAQAARTPDACAVQCGGQRLSYAELDRRANRVAHQLAAWGVGPDDLVAVALERSLELPVALLGILKAGGATAWFGKNHNTPTFEITPIGPFDHWPNGLGFEYFYGFMGAETNPWAPTLYENTRPVQAPNEPGYHMEKDFAQRAANWIRTQHSLAPNKPFMMYYAPGTAHSPLAAPKEWIARYEGKFDQGWDKLREETFARQKKLGIIPQDAVLTPRPEQIPAWDSLSAEQKRVSARGMEVYAAAISYCDAQLKTLFSTLDELGERDNTLVVFLVGDNGSSAEGGFYGTTNDFYHLNGRPDDFEELLASVDALGSPQTASQFPVGFGWAMNAPFPWFKQVAGHLGGTRNGLIMSWPGHTRQEHQVRSQFASVIDIAPTLYQAAGITAPKRVDGVEQRPLEGVSLLDSLTNPKAPSLHHTQYFEVFANRGIYHDGWLASTTPAKLPWDPPTPISPQDYQWELYDLNKDFSQSHDLAAREPEKLRQMQALFVEQAKRYNVLPLDNRTGPRAAPQNRPNLLNGRSEFTFWRSDERYGATAWPSVMNRSWSLDVQVEPDKDSPDGMIVGDGGLTGGWGLMVLGGKPVLVYRNGATASQEYRVEGPALGKGSHRLQVAFNYDGGGRGKGGTFVLTVDGKRAGEMKIPASLAFLFAEEGATIGRDVGTPLLADYRLPFVFTGEIGPVNIRLQPLSP